MCTVYVVTEKHTLGPPVQQWKWPQSIVGPVGRKWMSSGPKGYNTFRVFWADHLWLTVAVTVVTPIVDQVQRNLWVFGFCCAVTPLKIYLKIHSVRLKSCGKLCHQYHQRNAIIIIATGQQSCSPELLIKLYKSPGQSNPMISNLTTLWSIILCVCVWVSLLHLRYKLPIPVQTDGTALQTDSRGIRWHSFSHGGSLRIPGLE